MFVVFRRAVPWAAFALALATGQPADAQQAAPGTPNRVPAPEARPVESLVERALAEAPSLAVRRERIAAARASLQAAGALPDPMLEFEYQSFNFPRYTIGSDPSSMAGVSVRQGLLTGGRRAASRSLALAEVGRQEAERRLAAADLGTEVRVQYARLYAIDRERDTLSDASELVRMIEATVAARYAAGSADQASLLRVQLEQTRLGQRISDLAAERLGVSAALNRLTNDPIDAPIGRVTMLPPASLPPAALALTEQGAAETPAVAARQSELDVATRQVESARAELKPNWSVGAGVYWQGGLDRMVNLNVGVELPIWKKRKQEPMLAAAESERRAAQFGLQSTSLEVRAQAATLLAQYRNAVEQVERYKDGLLPQNTAALDAARSSYLVGQGDFVSVLDEFRRWIDLRTELAGREADRYTAQARLAGLLAPAGL